MPGLERVASLRWLSWPPLMVAALLVVAIVGPNPIVALVGDSTVTTRWCVATLVLALGGAATAAIRYAASALAAERDAQGRIRQLAESQAWTGIVVQTAVEGVITINECGIIESFNHAAEGIFGYSADEVIGRNISMLMPPPDCDRHDEYIASHLRTGESKGIGIARERRGRRKNGAAFPLEVAVSEVHLPDRRLFAGICHDISKRKDAEAALAASRSFLQTVIDGIPDSLMVIDRDFRVVLANRAVRESTGGKDPVAGLLTCYQASHHCDAPCEGEHVCPLKQVVATRAPVTVMHTHRDANGDEVLMEVIAAPILDKSGEVIQVIEASRDVTARVQAENQARQRQAELAHLARLGTMGEMAAGLAHELNQPLSAIVNYTQACLERIQAGVAEPGELLEDLENAGTQAERAGAIIEHVRAFVRKTDPQRSEADLNELVREALGLLHSEIRQRDVELRLELSETLPAIHVVPIQIVQVIVNLIQNALDSMNGTHTAERQLVITAGTAQGGGVELAVCDTGVGLPSAHAEWAFDPFFTTKPDGMGMGLSMCRSIVEAHGGRIMVLSGEENGATVRFTLPPSDGHGDHE